MHLMHGVRDWCNARRVGPSLPHTSSACHHASAWIRQLVDRCILTWALLPCLLQYLADPATAHPKLVRDGIKGQALRAETHNLSVSRRVSPWRWGLVGPELG